MEYKFRYKSKLSDRDIFPNYRIWITKLLFGLYKNKLFKKLKLNKNESIRYHVEYDKPLLKHEFPKDHTITPTCFVFIDIINLEDKEILKSKIISFLRLYSDSNIKTKSNDIIRIINDYDKNLNSFSWGNLAHLHNLKKINLDLVDYIIIHAIKSPSSHIIIIYSVLPSSKFLDLYHEYIQLPRKETKIVHFNSFKQAIKTKKLINGISTHFSEPGSNARKLYEEINNQVKTIIHKEIGLGIFANHKTYLFPQITVLDIEKTEFSNYNTKLCMALGLEPWSDYYTDNNEILFNMPFIRLTNRVCQLFTIINLKEKEKININLRSIEFPYEEYSSAIVVPWIIMNLAGYYQIELNEHKHKTFRYFRKNKDSLFLKNAMKLKYKITENWLILKRIFDDFNLILLTKKFYYYDIPKATNKDSRLSVELKDALFDYSKSDLENTLEHYKDLLTVFNQISSDNVTRSNLKIQRILILIAIIAIFITVYGTNSEFFNTLFKNLFQRIFITP